MKVHELDLDMSILEQVPKSVATRRSHGSVQLQATVVRVEPMAQWRRSNRSNGSKEEVEEDSKVDGSSFSSSFLTKTSASSQLSSRSSW